MEKPYINIIQPIYSFGFYSIKLFIYLRAYSTTIRPIRKKQEQRRNQKYMHIGQNERHSKADFVI
jgi:hypothetical protein